MPATVTGSVPAALGLPAGFGAFRPGLERDYEAPMSANVVSTAGEARLTVADGPVSNDAVSLRVRQSIGAREGLQTGVSIKTLTFTLSTTMP